VGRRTRDGHWQERCRCTVNDDFRQVVPAEVGKGPAPLYSEGEDVDDTTPTPARPWPAITPAVDDDLRDRRPAR